MSIKEFVNGIIKARQFEKVYRMDELTKEEEQVAKENGFVVVYGYSDDCAEFRGAFDDEVGCFDGGIVLEQDGYYINAVWGKDGVSWTYDTNIPHESFDVWDEEDNTLYCKAIVFDIKQLAQPPKKEG